MFTPKAQHGRTPLGASTAKLEAEKLVANTKSRDRSFIIYLYKRYLERFMDIKVDSGFITKT
ncbi:hypothetical protein JCM19236_5758 [Vibrio sp. JCM 19236]|nr:hypothetical protein JCM19236_5758 [Vibrio sp. JCM 19236]